MGNNRTPKLRCPKNFFDLLDILLWIDKRVKSARLASDRSTFVLDDLENEIKDLKTRLRAKLKVPMQVNPFKGGADVPTPKKLNKEAKDFLKRLAENGVARLTTKTRSGGEVDVCMDDDAQHFEFTLRPLVGKTLIALAKDLPKTGLDAFVSLKSNQYIADEIDRIPSDAEDRSRRRIAPIICRLRQELWDKGVNPYYVQTSDGGARFLLRRSAPKADGGGAEQLR